MIKNQWTQLLTWACVICLVAVTCRIMFMLGHMSGASAMRIEAERLSPAELDSEYTASIVEEFTSNHSGSVQGYVLIHLPGMGKQKDLTFRLRESRAKELAEKIKDALVGLPWLMKEK